MEGSNNAVPRSMLYIIPHSIEFDAIRRSDELTIAYKQTHFDVPIFNGMSCMRVWI